jgi:hypothetical protein
MPDYTLPRDSRYLPQQYPVDLSQIGAVYDQQQSTPSPLAMQASTQPASSGLSPMTLLSLLGNKGGGNGNPKGVTRKGGQKGGGGHSGGGKAITAKGLPNHPNALRYAKVAANMANVPEKWARDKRSWYILSHESGLSKHGNYHAVQQAAHNANPTSSAYGIPQFLDSTWNRYPKTNDPLKQFVDYFIYLKSRYGGLGHAYSFKKSHGWY